MLLPQNRATRLIATLRMTDISLCSRAYNAYLTALANYRAKNVGNVLKDNLFRDHTSKEVIFDGLHSPFQGKLLYEYHHNMEVMHYLQSILFHNYLATFQNSC